MKKQIILVSFLVMFLLLASPAAAGNNLCVQTTSSCSGTQYSTISAAVTAAAEGDTVYVGPGLYNERIAIGKAITLKGATAGVSKKGYIVPDNYAYNSGTESVIQPSTLADQPVVQISVGNVTFDGFVVAVTVAKTYPTYAQTNLIQMYAGGNLNNVTIQNNVLGPVTNLTDQDGNSGRMVIAISKHSPGTGQNNVTNLQIRNNKIFDAKGDGCGILMIGTRNTSTDAVTPSIQNQYKGAIIDNNEISGNHRSGIDFSAGVQGGPAAADHIRITNNLISNNGWNITDKDNIKWGNGIVMIRMTNQLNDVLPWASRYIDIENNEFSGNEKNAIYIGPITKDVTIKSNIIRNNGAGTSPAGVTGFSRWDGIRIDLDETYQIEELARHPEQGTYSGQKIYDYLTNVVVGENLISGNGGYGLQVIQTPLNGTVDVRKNWWGASSGPLNTATNPSGAGDRVSDNVRYSPWYTSAAKTTTQSAASGDGAILYVSPKNFTTIQKAINAAWPGDTIKVFPGTYDERIVINKSLTLLGATNGGSKKDYVVPAAYAYDATKESVISPSVDKNEPVVQIQSGTVSFDGFIVEVLYAEKHPDYTYPFTDLISINNQSNNYSNVQIKNNVVGPNTNAVSQDGGKGRMGIVVPGPYEKTVYNLTIANNKIFNATGDGCGILLLGSQNTSTPALAAKYRGTKIDNNTIAGNHRSGIEFSGGVQGSADAAGHIKITSNNITGNGWNGTADKDNVKYGNGIVLTRIGSDKSTFNYQFASAWGPRYVDIDNNLISNNEKNGIYLGPTNQFITITNNILSKNGAGTSGYTAWDGVRVDLDEVFQKATDKDYGNLSNIVVKSNDIIENGDYGVRVIQTPTLGSIDARNNWWGSASGPRPTTTASWTASNVSENVLFSPWYSSSIKTSANTLPLPMASFTVDPVEAMNGETFSFDASASEGQSKSTIKSYQWDYGDGNTSAASSSPLSSWIYKSSKVYTITLTVKDSNGMSNKTTRQATVIAKKEAIALTFNGTSVSGTTGEQKITIDSTKINGTMTNSTKEVKIENPSNGWSEMVVKGNTSGGNGAPVTVKDITEVVLKSKPSITELDTTSSDGAAGPGSVTTSIQLSLKEFASAPLQVEVTQGANTSISDAFQIAAGSDNKVDAVAYTMTIKGSSMINSNLSSSSEPVILNMSVSEAWVKEHGGIDAIKAIRYSDNGDTKEVLETQYQFSAGIPVMYYFRIISPHGCSIFGIASVSAVPPSQSSSGSSVSSSPVSGSGGGSGGGSFTSKDQAQEKRAPLQPKEEVPVVPRQSSAPVQPQHTYAAPLITPEMVEEIPIAGPAEAGLQRLLAPIFTFILENVTAIGIGAATIVLSVALVSWHRRRRQYWR
jgi:hypothetical protein